MHDLFSFVFVIDFKSAEILRSSEFELGDAIFVFLDSDPFRLGEILLLSSDNLNEFL